MIKTKIGESILKTIWQEKLGEKIIAFRWPILIIIFLFTGYMGYETYRLNVQTLFRDLLPQNHPYVLNHLKHQKQFGGANQVTIQLKVKKGTIFNTKTLQKLWDLNEDCQFLPCVDKYKVISLAAKKVRDVKVTDWGIKSPPLMKTVPDNAEKICSLEDAVLKNDMVYGGLVSLDKKAALVITDFFEEEIDYLKIFNALQDLKKKYEDENHTVSMAGFPLVYGYVTKYLGQTFNIMVIILAVVAGFLYLSTLTWRGTILPIFSGLLCGLWGTGIMSLAGYNLDPLVIVLPFIILLMAIRHSVQVIKRFNELYFEKDGRAEGDKQLSSVLSVKELLTPAFSGIITDAAGLFLVAIAPIAMLRKVSITATVWILLTLVIALVLNPILLSLIKSPKHKRKRDILDSFMSWTGRIVIHPRVKYVFVIFWCAMLVSGVLYSKGHLIIGETRPGTSILWPDDPYNTDVAMMDQHFPGMLNPLAIYFEGNEFESLKEPVSLYELASFQKHMETSPYVTKTHSIIDLVRKVSMTFHEDHPKWEVLPETKINVGQMLLVLTYGGAEPGDFDRYFDWSYKDSNFLVYIVDQTGDTIRKVMDNAKGYVGKMNEKMTTGKFILAGGPMGVLAATDEALSKSSTLILESILGFIFLVTLITYRSVLAGVIVVFPLVISNYIVYSYMNYNQLGLTVATIPVCAIGLGLGVDFIYYIISRIRDDYALLGDLDKSIQNALSTTGRAVFILGMTLCIGVMAWHFSKLMFQAQMGFLIGFVLILNLLNAIFLIPSIIATLKPKFIMKVAASK
jgi:uncharacterized protein